MSEAVRDSIVVQADPDTVMDVIADFEAYPQWQDEVKDVQILETDEDGWATLVRFTVDAKITTATFTLAYTYTDNGVQWHLVEGQPIKQNEGAYALDDLGDGTTRVDYRVEIDPGVPLPGLLKRQAAKRIADTALKGMKRRVESLA